MNAIKIKDLSFGTMNEQKVLRYLNKRKRFNGSLRKTENQYETFDFENDNYICELKSRRVPSKRYPTAMCGLNKVKDIRKYPNKKIRFYFLFTDGLYYWDYKKNTAGSLIENEWFCALGGRSDRGKDEHTMMLHIKRDYLNKATSKINSVEFP